MTAPQAYPLQWPVGKKRTPASARRRAAFGKRVTKQYGEGENAWTTSSKGGLSMADAVRRIQGEVDKMDGAALPVLSTNVELRLDGLPRSGQRRPEDPGAALYFQLHGKPIVLACDTYDSVEDNVAAIAKHLEATRAIERHGVGTLDELFRGFAALPPAMAPDDWRDPLGDPRTLEEAEKNYRERSRYAHPDAGGHEVVQAKLNAAIARAREFFKGA